MNSFTLRVTAKAALMLATFSYMSLPAEASDIFGLFNHGKCHTGHCGHCNSCGSASYGGAAGYATGGPFAASYGGMIGGMTGYRPPGAPPPGFGVRRRPRRPLPPVALPPGTLGKTYRQPSRPIPENRHPRIAMLDVYGVPDAQVTVAGMKGYRSTNGIWHFETKKPLVPGNPFIFEVHATGSGCKTTGDLRVVRLIPNRIVTLTY